MRPVLNIEHYEVNNKEDVVVFYLKYDEYSTFIFPHISYHKSASNFHCPQLKTYKISSFINGESVEITSIVSLIFQRTTELPVSIVQSNILGAHR